MVDFSDLSPFLGPFGPLVKAGSDMANGTYAPYNALKGMAPSESPNSRVQGGFDMFGPAPYARGTDPMAAGGAPAPAPAADPGPQGPTSVGGAPLDGSSGPTSVGGAPLSGYAGVTPQNAAPQGHGLISSLANAFSGHPQGDGLMSKLAGVFSGHPALQLAPQAPLTDPTGASMPPQQGFFARNTAMMKDPVTGGYVDPTAGQSAEATGPDLIQKFMTYLHDKR